ncbi:hypothetical protein L21SP2_0707 [Salinispira pacifica]|uniref:Uncharacterized protein n=1 Tax=Salinispira pacifica TaxID=1307761 RepID=V5WEA8_9SPIO|nr:hypothetical protein L21SP2_0707 [Salinispira pacifica]
MELRISDEYKDANNPVNTAATAITLPIIGLSSNGISRDLSFFIACFF